MYLARGMYIVKYRGAMRSLESYDLTIIVLYCLSVLLYTVYSILLGSFVKSKMILLVYLHN